MVTDHVDIFVHAYKDTETDLHHTRALVKFYSEMNIFDKLHFYSKRRGKRENHTVAFLFLFGTCIVYADLSLFFQVHRCTLCISS